MIRFTAFRPCFSACIVAALAGCASAPEYSLEILVPGSPMHGVHGLAFDADDNLYGASLTGYSIYQVDTATGEVTTKVGPPLGSADDVAVAADGTIAWTAGAYSAVHALTPDGEVITLADGLPGINSINYSRDGRLFATQVFGGDALWEIDPSGSGEKRQIAKKLGGLNGFEIGPDGWLYGPLFLRGKVVRVDVENGAVEIVAEEFPVPAAVNFDSRGRLYLVDFDVGSVTRIDVDTGATKVIAELEPPLDNLAINSRDEIYVSNPAINTITAIDPDTGATRRVTTGHLSGPGGIAVTEIDGSTVVLVADHWGNRYFDAKSGERTMLSLPQGVLASASIAAQGQTLALASIWPLGLVYVIDMEAGKVVKTAKATTPYSPVFLADGGVVVADYAKGTVTKLAPGRDRGQTELAAGLEGPVGVAVDADALYVAEYDAGRISRLVIGTGERRVIAEGLDRPEGLAVAGGRLFVAETGMRRLLGIEIESGAVSVIADELSIGLAGGPDMPAPFLPTGVAVDAEGNVYVSADADNAVYKLSRSN